MSRPQLVWSSILAGLQVFSGGAVLADVLPKNWLGLFVLSVAALQSGTVYYQHQAKQPQIDADGLGGSGG